MREHTCPISIDGPGGSPHFTLHAHSSSYSFFVGPNGDLIHSHLGGTSHGPLPPTPEILDGGWLSGPPTSYYRAQREFPDNGNGDWGLPAIRVRHDGTTVTRFVYHSHEVVHGKPELKGLPSIRGSEDEDVWTLRVTMKDQVAELELILSYTVFPAFDAFTRSSELWNKGKEDVVLERAASFSVDLDHADEGREMIQLSGQWARETQIIRRQVYPGFQGVQSLTGFSGHTHNPFLAIVSPSTTETHGSALGFSLIYSGSFSASVERGPSGLDRVQIGLNPLQLDWTVRPREKFISPEAVAVCSPSEGLGGMSRKFHRLYRSCLSQSSWTHRDRPVLINTWEGVYFNFDQEKIYTIAEQASELGCTLTVLDDGWFGNKYPRNDDTSGLGDWKVNETKLKGGLEALVTRINQLKNQKGQSMKFGLWVEPEHVNRRSELYEAHPDWVLHAQGAHGSTYPLVEQRHQLILNLSLPQVQEYIIDTMSALFASTDIAYIKWDSNKGIEQLPHPSTGHAYILGLYRILHELTARFPHILWEGCASGGGRFDPGMLYYFPGSWTSDNTDPVDRLYIQSGNSLVYPPSSTSGHISLCRPNHQTGRTTPLEFGAHVAMMCGSFGLELDPSSLSQEDKEAIPGLIRLSERISPYIVHGDLYRLSRPDESNWPAVMYIKRDRSGAVVMAFQVYDRINVSVPTIRLAGLDAEKTYTMKEDGTSYRGDTLMNAGIRLPWKKGDYQSKVIFLTAVA